METAEVEKAELFQIKGEKPQWEIIYDAVKDYPIGSRLNYGQLNAMTGLDVQGKQRAIIYLANNHLLKTHQKMLLNIRDEGYRIAFPPEQVEHAKWRKKRGTRQLKKGVQELINLDTSGMSNDEKTNITHLINHFQTAVTFVRKRNIEALDLQAKTIEKQKNGLEEIDKVMGQLAELKRQLA